MNYYRSSLARFRFRAGNYGYRNATDIYLKICIDGSLIYQIIIARYFGSVAEIDVSG